MALILGIHYVPSFPGPAQLSIANKEYGKAGEDLVSRNLNLGTTNTPFVWVSGHYAGNCDGHKLCGAGQQRSRNWTVWRHPDIGSDNFISTSTLNNRISDTFTSWPICDRFKPGKIVTLWNSASWANRNTNLPMYHWQKCSPDGVRLAFLLFFRGHDIWNDQCCFWLVHWNSTQSQCQRIACHNRASHAGQSWVSGRQHMSYSI